MPIKRVVAFKILDPFKAILKSMFLTGLNTLQWIINYRHIVQLFRTNAAILNLILMILRTSLVFGLLAPYVFFSWI